MVSVFDYLERVMGYAPRTAQDRMRVARALGALPQLTAVLAKGELPFSAVRELTRVATPETEAAWCRAAAAKTVRQLEELVADHRPGDNPDDPPEPQVRTHVVRYELSSETFARTRQARQALDNEHGTNLSDEEFLAALCSAVLDGAPTTEPTGRAKFQVAITLCQRCGQGWQEGGGVQVPIDDAAVERAMCDAQHIGSIDGDVPERAHQDIPPSIVRLVWRRDGGRCRISGCRSSRGLELHHIVHRADGGGHVPSNLILACSSCHGAHHRGVLHITGTAEHLEVRRPGEAMRSTKLVVLAESHHPDGMDDEISTAAQSLAKASCQSRPLTKDLPVHGDVGLERRARVVDVVDGTTRVAVAVAAVADRSGADADLCNTPATTFAGTPFAMAELPAIVGVQILTGSRNAHVGSCVTSSGVAGAGPRAGGVEERTAVATNAERSVGKLERAVRREETKAALIGMGWKPGVARTAVAEAIDALSPDATLEQLIREALCRCPRSSTMTGCDVKR